MVGKMKDGREVGVWKVWSTQTGELLEEHNFDKRKGK
jgi:hypothetical protein